MGCDTKNRYQKIYFMPFSFYCANYTACSESNSLASSLSSGQGPVFAIWKCIRNCPSAFLYFMYWEDQTIYYELYHKILKPKKGTRKLILMTVADKQAQPFPLHLLLLLRRRVINHTNSSGKRKQTFEFSGCTGLPWGGPCLLMWFCIIKLYC